MALGDTWELAGESWTKVAASGPAARQAHVMVFDSKRNRTLVFGGMGVGEQGQAPPQLSDTWEFDGTAWSQK